VLEAVGEVRFDTEGPYVVFGEGKLLTQLQLVIPAFPIASYQQDGPWHVRFNSPGCYGLQIDWLQGTEQIIFRAEAEPSSG
jgi:hypothetical protein